MPAVSTINGNSFMIDLTNDKAASFLLQVQNF
jgi:hypothetical protein